MGWADDMHEAGYTKEHGGLMDEGSSFHSYQKTSKSKKSGPGSRWTEYDRNRMVDMYKTGVNIKKIAQKLNRTPLAIACQLYNKNEITSTIKEKFLEERSFDTSINTINNDKITPKKKSKSRNLNINENSFKKDHSFDVPLRTVKNNKPTPKGNTKTPRSGMKILGFMFIAIAVFGWPGFWFAGSGFAALIAFGFLVTGLSLIGNDN